MNVVEQPSSLNGELDRMNTMSNGKEETFEGIKYIYMYINV